MTEPSGRPAAAYPYDLPPKLARRLLHGEMSRADVDLALEQGAAVIVATRRHVPDPPDMAWARTLLRHLLDQWLGKLGDDRRLIAYRIRRTVWKLAEERSASHIIYGQAHDINGGADFPLAEREVTAIVDSVLTQIMRGGRRNG